MTPGRHRARGPGCGFAIGEAPGLSDQGSAGDPHIQHMRGRIAQPSHRITGNRRDSVRGSGWEYAHVAIDDCSRFAYVEILPDELRYTATRFWLRAVRAFQRHGIRVQRVLTDNGGAYRSRPFRKTCRWLGISAKRTRPYRPQTTDEIEQSLGNVLC